MHDPTHWCEYREPTLFPNPGRCPDIAAFPNYVLVQTERMRCRFLAAPHGGAGDLYAAPSSAALAAGAGLSSAAA